MATSINATTVDKKTLPLVVIVGPTASGKSATAMRIAEDFNGEIICADSRTVYKNMDIGTAKPSLEDQARVPHWGIDLVEPGEPFSAADFKKYTLLKVQQIRERGHLPVLVGGTGLYVDGVIFDYDFAEPRPELRKELEALSLEDLKLYCANNNVELPENDKNRRYLIRAIERQSISIKGLSKPIANTIIVGITTERDVLRGRIAARAEQLFENGMVEEAIKLGKKYGWKNEAMTGNIYKLVHQYVDGELTKEQLKEKFITSDWRLAKRQLTYLKRNTFIQWKSLSDAYEYISSRLNS
ncbi:MAG: tRNA (adenosine(37)-N6)-dimethylallyltransferase MiaA [Candidatus Microsaccharimonas sp.]